MKFSRREFLQSAPLGCVLALGGVRRLGALSVAGEAVGQLDAEGVDSSVAAGSGAGAGAGSGAGAGARAGSDLPMRPLPDGGAGGGLPVLGVVAADYLESLVRAGDAERGAELLRMFYRQGGRILLSRAYEDRSFSALGRTLALMADDVDFFHGVAVWGRNRQALRAQIEGAYISLGRGKLDLLVLRGLADFKDQWLELKRLKSDGRLGYMGAWVETEHEMQALPKQLEDCPVDFVVLPYSLRTRVNAQSLITYARQRGLALISFNLFENQALLFKLRRKSLPAWAVEAGYTSWKGLLLAHAIARGEVPFHCVPDKELSGISKLAQAARLPGLTEPQIQSLEADLAGA